MARGAFFPGNVFIKTADVPGEDPQGAGRFFGVEAGAGMEGQKAVDIWPADDQHDQGQKSPGPPGPEEKADNEEANEDQEQEREDESEEGDEPPSAGMEER